MLLPENENQSPPRLTALDGVHFAGASDPAPFYCRLRLGRRRHDSSVPGGNEGLDSDSLCV